MALKLSTGLRNKMLGLQATVVAYLIGTDGALVDGGGSADTITDSGNTFITAGFCPNQILFLQGATTGANDTAVTGVAITSVVAGTLTIPTGTVDTAESFAAGTVLAAAEGGSMKDILRDGVLRIYSGSQPSSPDSAVAGTLLLEITESAGTFAHAAFANGIEFGAAASGAISKNSGETWQDTGISSGTAGWFRFCGNPSDTGAASTTLPRIDGTIGTSGADLNMASVAISAGATHTIDTFTITMPQYYGA